MKCFPKTKMKDSETEARVLDKIEQYRMIYLTAGDLRVAAILAGLKTSVSEILRGK